MLAFQLRLQKWPGIDRYFPSLPCTFLRRKERGGRVYLRNIEVNVASLLEEVPPLRMIVINFISRPQFQATSHAR